MSPPAEQMSRSGTMTTGSKEEYVERLFARIAGRYDLLNSVLSLNLHKSWRRFAVGRCGLSRGHTAVDVCTGTGDLAIEIARAVGAGEVTAVDFCRPMLDLCALKLARRRVGSVTLVQGNAEQLPLPSDAYKAATIGFAMRNVSDIERTFSEMARVVEPGGRVVCLEFARPRGRVLARLYSVYSRRVLPAIGGLLSGSREAYEYLPASVEAFLSRKELSDIMEKAGLGDVETFDLTGGIVAVHVGVKK